MKINKHKKKLIILTLLLVFFIIPVFINNTNTNNIDGTLKTSTDNYIFNGKDYTFDLDDVYDDENYTKIYTGANFQTVFLENESIILNETVSPVNNTNYKSPFVNGNYPATYSFEDDTEGDSPSGWTGNTDYYEVNNSHLDHNKVLNCIGDGIGGKSLTQDLGGWKTEGTIEWWWNLNDYSHSYVIFNLRNSTTTMQHRMIAYGALATPHIGCDNGGFLYPTALGWHHYKVEIDCATNLISYWMDEVLLLADKGFRNDFEPDNITSIQLLFSGGVPVGEKVYWDAFGYSWDPCYTIGDNLYSEPITMLNGTFDNTDNMKINDNNYSNFTSVGSGSGTVYLDPDGDISTQWHPTPGPVHFTGVDDGIRQPNIPSTGDRISAVDGYENKVDSFNFETDTVGIITSITLWHYGKSSSGEDPRNMVWIGGGWSALAYCGFTTGSSWKSRVFVGAWSQADIDALQVYYLADSAYGEYDSSYIYAVYFEVPYTNPTELNFTVDMDFSDLDTSKLLALDVSSHHYTNISINIIGNIYNYDSSSYTQMFNSSNTEETLNYFMNDTIPTDYLNNTGNLRLYFTGTGADFKQIIDYIRVRFYYKMDLTHSISFETNGLWKYRWELIGSLQYTDWTYFEVVDPVPNFHAISESDTTTRWILQNSTLSAVEDFNDDINTDYWNLESSGSNSFTEGSGLLEDSYATENSPSNPHDGTALSVSLERYSKEYRTFVKVMDSNYLTENASSDTILQLYQYYSVGATMNVKVNESGSFDEATLTWNNQPIADVYVAQTSVSTSNGWKNINLGDGFNTYYCLQGDVVDALRKYWDTEKGDWTPVIYNYLYKNYFGSGYMYMQTDEIELISLKSVDYGTHYNLSSGDYFEVDFQTSSDSQIDLILLKDGVVNKTLTLSQSGNNNFNNQTIKISTDEFVEFDQLKITSTIEDQDNIKVYDIKTFKYTSIGDSADFYVSPNNQRDIYITPDTYNLRIFDPYDGAVKVNENITIPETGIKQYVYTPESLTPKTECLLTLFPAGGGLSLTFADYIIYVNYSYNGVYERFLLNEEIFEADDLTIVYIDVYDRFGLLIGTFPEPIAVRINLDIEVYQLEIINLMTQMTTIDINSTTLYESELASGRWVNLILSKNYYQIGYYDSDNDYHQFSIYLDSNQVYELNRSKICFLSYADQQANHLSFDNYKTYINGTLIYENIFYEDAGDHINITITDRYDYEVYQDVYVVTSGDNYIPITLSMYSLKVMNQQENFNHINITRDPNDSEYFWSEWIAPGERIEFKLFAGDYVINLTDTENGWSSYGYELNGDDTLLFTSDNIISNVLINIANTNTTIGNLITYVQIDLTNQNTEINNSIISIVINIENINSTLGDLLIDIDTAITNINSSIISEIISLGTEITNINSSISDQILTITTDISNLDTSIVSQFLTLGVAIENINGSIIDQILLIGVNISNVQTYLNNQILNIGVNISNLDTSITNQIVSVISSIENVNTTLFAQISSLSSDIINVNSSIIGQMVALGVNITNVQTVITDQLLLLEVDITNINTSIIDQILLVIADIENLETVIGDQTLTILSDITNVNTTLLNQIVSLGVDLTNINATIINQILTMNVDLTNINASISNLLFYLDVDITSIANDISTLYIFAENSFVNLNNSIDDYFININNEIISINETISNLVIGIDNSIYLINGTISTLISVMENNLLLMNVSIDTALFDLGTTLDIIGSNITSNFIVINNSISLVDNNIDSSTLAILNNILLVNNTISDLITSVYSSVYLINNSIYTAVVDLGTYLSLINNTISGDLSIVLEMNEFLTEMYQMTMFSDLLNWTNIASNTTLFEEQVDVWSFINDYRDQSIEVHLKYNDIIDNLTVSAQNTIEQYLPATGVDYRLWSVEIQDYLTAWTPLPENKTVSFGFYETEVPYDPEPLVTTFTSLLIAILFFVGLSLGVLKLYYSAKERKTPIPPELLRYVNKKNKKHINGAVDDRL